MARYRFRTWLRGRSPWWLIDLGFARKGKRDCGDHDWYRRDSTTARCYHCEPGVRALRPDQQIDDLYRG